MTADRRLPTVEAKILCVAMNEDSCVGVVFCE